MTAPCVFVTGIWKSGNHLAYSALNAMGVPGPFNGIAAHLLFGRHAWAKRIVRGPRAGNDAIQVGLETDAHVSGRYIAGQAKRLAGRIMGGHAAHSPRLEAILQQEGARMICIRRDPRDILVSFADWIGQRPDYFMHPAFASLEREARVRLLLRGGQLDVGRLHPFPVVMRRAAGWLSSARVLNVSFEELIGPAGGGDADSQAKALAAIHAHVNAPLPLEQVEPATIYGGSLTFNKGRSHRWRELDDPELVQEIEDVIGPHLGCWGYSA